MATSTASSSSSTSTAAAVSPGAQGADDSYSSHQLSDGAADPQGGDTSTADPSAVSAGASAKAPLPADAATDDSRLA